MWLYLFVAEVVKKSPQPKAVSSLWNSYFSGFVLYEPAGALTVVTVVGHGG